MIGDVLPVRILTMRVLPNLPPAVAQELGLKREYRSVGLISADSDDVTYLALDEATKAANVEVVYGKSLYAGASNASTALAGEVIGIIAGPTPSDVIGGLQGAERFLRSGVGFQTANETGDIVYLAHCVSRTGTYLSAAAGIPVGQSLAYLIAPPVEAMVGLDAALKAAEVELCVFYAPPTETNFGGALLTGSQSACQAACRAFAEAVQEVAAHPKNMGGI